MSPRSKRGTDERTGDLEDLDTSFCGLVAFHCCSPAAGEVSVPSSDCDRCDVFDNGGSSPFSVSAWNVLTRPVSLRGFRGRVTVTKDQKRP